ncbi:MAG: hypothetical protein L0Z52_13065 [Acidobacteria bacterium]|nr:hypothetical protein [Acidobacteriota bacterium]
MMGQAGPGQKAVGADSFILIGKDGKPRAELSLTDGEPGLWFYRKSGKVAARIAMDVMDQPYLGLNDEEGHQRAYLGLAAGGASRLTLSRKNSAEQISLAADPTDISLGAMTPSGMQIQGIGSPGLLVTDMHGHPAIFLGQYAYSPPPPNPSPDDSARTKGWTSAAPITTFSYFLPGLLLFNGDTENSVAIWGEVFPSVTIADTRNSARAVLGSSSDPFRPGVKPSGNLPLNLEFFRNGSSVWAAQDATTAGSSKP